MIKAPRVISFSVFNTFCDNDVVRFDFPYLKDKSMLGFYSGFWRDIKPKIASAEKIDRNFIRVNITFGFNKTDRMIISLANGLRFDSPFPLSKKDFEIIGLHLDALKLARQ